jgi:hypothetical protein
MHPSSDSIHSAAKGTFLHLVLVIVLLAAGSAGVLVTVNAHLGFLTLGLGLVAGPVGVVVEDRARAARRAIGAPAARLAPETRAAPV